MRLDLTLEPITASNSAFIFDEDAVLSLGGGRRPKVVATVEGVTWRTSIAPMGGRFLLGLTKAQKAETAVLDGRTYAVEVTLDTQERIVDVPDDLAAEFAGRPELKDAWDAWSYTKRKEAATSLLGAKQAATRARRLAALLDALA